jgi:hypothetical protein
MNEDANDFAPFAHDSGPCGTEVGARLAFDALSSSDIDHKLHA